MGIRGSEKVNNLIIKVLKVKWRKYDGEIHCPGFYFILKDDDDYISFIAYIHQLLKW